jgi:hypothetical protein
LKNLIRGKSQIVELRFGGPDRREISSALGISVATVHREWALGQSLGCIASCRAPIG